MVIRSGIVRIHVNRNFPGDVFRVGSIFHFTFVNSTGRFVQAAAPPEFRNKLPDIICNKIADGHDTQLKECQFGLFPIPGTFLTGIGTRKSCVPAGSTTVNQAGFFKIRRDLGNQLALLNPNRTGQNPCFFASILDLFCKECCIMRTAERTYVKERFIDTDLLEPETIGPVMTSAETFEQSAKPVEK
jgi:hypothetical protein